MKKAAKSRLRCNCITPKARMEKKSRQHKDFSSLSLFRFVWKCCLLVRLNGMPWVEVLLVHFLLYLAYFLKLTHNSFWFINNAFLAMLFRFIEIVYAEHGWQLTSHLKLWNIWPDHWATCWQFLSCLCWFVIHCSIPVIYYAKIPSL